MHGRCLGKSCTGTHAQKGPCKVSTRQGLAAPALEEFETSDKGPRSSLDMHALCKHPICCVVSCGARLVLERNPGSLAPHAHHLFLFLRLKQVACGPLQTLRRPHGFVLGLNSYWSLSYPDHVHHDALFFALSQRPSGKAPLALIVPLRKLPAESGMFTAHRALPRRARNRTSKNDLCLPRDCLKPALSVLETSTPGSPLQNDALLGRGSNECHHNRLSPPQVTPHPLYRFVPAPV